MVRDDYFEPMLGHTATKALAALENKIRLGRPCLLETHRANFLGDERVVNNAMHELSSLMQQALERFPGLRFISTEDLATAMVMKDPQWLDSRSGRRLAVMAKRIADVPRLGKLARLSGFSLLLQLVAGLLGKIRTNENPAT